MRNFKIVLIAQGDRTRGFCRTYSTPEATRNEQPITCQDQSGNTCRWEDNNKTDFKTKKMDGSELDPHEERQKQWQAFVNTDRNLRVPLTTQRYGIEVTSNGLCLEYSRYPDRRFLWFSLDPPGKSRESTFKLCATTLYHVPPNSSVNVIPTIRSFSSKQLR
jgi:hypothetical protein